ncbi:response regulator [Geitlerinema sp. P-1104]|uniref:response regulator n=1 Tax=Geitlerinema sp. P-1104 TaxID=2546230 RepID=UPI001476FB25|nr:response regulator [Geitlerinema sp. P-1104]NMG58618.1 response regulator [Geitlerinema sp. P-1104]
MATILVIDDEITTQLVLQDLLEGEGHDVLMADDGQQGWELASQHGPNLIICDWMMPKINGVDLCRQVKAEPQLEATFFILLTAREHLDDRVCGLNAGADDFISKPIETEELLARVRSGLRLNHLNQQLTQSLHDLQAAQVQLVQSEKMSSLGRLVGGVAHEINNPISFIYGNLSHIKEYTRDISHLIQQIRSDENFSRDQLLGALEDIDFDFVMADLENMLGSMKEGSERIREIVIALREFSSQERSGIHKIDLHHALDLAFSMLQPRLHNAQGRISVMPIEKQYGELPNIEGDIGLINQALFNILENSLDAILRRSQACQQDENWTPKLAISTRSLDSCWVEVEIVDNGVGIDTNLNGKIFDPFFTTKPVGQGKGLGLAVAYQIIVQQHHGQLSYDSQLHQGTHFFMRLPVSQASIQCQLPAKGYNASQAKSEQALPVPMVR